jgi:FkbM family methyltransferase
MDTRERIWHRLLSAERDARRTRGHKFLKHPLLYPMLMIFYKVIYPITHRSIPVRIPTFFGKRMKTMLPSGTDMALHSIKANDAEIRLSKFLTLSLQEGDTFIDVGAHYGYYTLMASVLTGAPGHVHAIEASAQTAIILKENVADCKNVIIHHVAASDTKGEIMFYEYPGPYAEYNTTLKDAYKNETWISKIRQIENRVKAIPLDPLLGEYKISKATIKIDAEGGETAVIKGLEQSLHAFDLTIIMEYNLPHDADAPNREAVALCREIGYKTHCIKKDGTLSPVEDIEGYLRKANLVTDNLVMKKKER